MLATWEANSSATPISALFSEQAVRKNFGHSAHGLPLSSIEEVFQEVENGNADFGFGDLPTLLVARAISPRLV